MSEVKWIKLSTDIFDNRKIKQIEKMPDGDAIIVIWLKLLILAGDVNDGGLVYFTKEIPYTEQLLATQFDRPLAVVQFALRTFEQFSMIEIVDDLICVSNWEKYQNVESLDRIREQTRKRVAKYRDKKKEALLPEARICVYCGKPGDTIDHIIPRSKGGLDIKENVVPCCLACNMEKTDRDVSDFLNSRLIAGEPVDIEGIQKNEILQRYVSFDYRRNRFVQNVTQDVTLRNATDIDKEKDKEGDKEKNKSVLDSFVIAQSVKDALSEFVQMRKKMKSPMTDRAICLLVNKLRSLSTDDDTQVEIINQSILNGWKSVYPLDERRSARDSRINTAGDENRTAAERWNIHYD